MVLAAACGLSASTGVPVVRPVAADEARDNDRDSAAPVPPRASSVVVIGVSAGRAGMIEDRALAVRDQIEAKLIGAVSRRPWVPPCAIHVHRDRASFNRAIGAAPAGIEGATSIEFLNNTVHRRRIDVMDGGDGGIPTALAHELVHVVLADRFTDSPPPRWADEGLATLFDSHAKRQGHEADFRSAAAQGQAWPLADLMAMEREPADGRRLRVFYGQSAAVVGWLLERADGPTFLKFIDDADGLGLDEAVRMHYRFESLRALEDAWRQAK